jgi:hypothetical protein
MTSQPHQEHGGCQKIRGQAESATKNKNCQSKLLKTVVYS